jgi:hypothetical protein
MCIKDKLYASFSDVKSRRGRGGVYEYISWKDVADRMNEVFGIHWSSEVMYQDIVGNNVVVRVRVMITDPDNGKIQYQEGFGGAQNDQSAEAGNPFKAAYSKALKDACKKWGVALFIEEEDGSAVSAPPAAPQNMNTPPPGFGGFETGVPPRQDAVAAPVTQVAPPAPKEKEPDPAVNSMPVPPGVAMTPPPGVAMNTPSIPTEAPTAPPVQNFPVTPEPVQQPTPPVQESAPAGPPVPPSVPTPPPVMRSQDLPMTNMGGTKSLISDVQRAALHSILQMQKISYEDLVTEAFQANGIVKNPIPQVDQLSYDEAVHVVKYGNDKFRKR